MTFPSANLKSMSDLPAPAGTLPTTDLGPAEPDLATLEAHGLAVLAYARGRFRSSWHALDPKAQADVKRAARELAGLTLEAAGQLPGSGARATREADSPSDPKAAGITAALLAIRETMRAWPWAGRRAAAKHLQRGAAHVAFSLARDLGGDERRAALRHSATLMGGKPSKAKRRRG